MRKTGFDKIDETNTPLIIRQDSLIYHHWVVPENDDEEPHWQTDDVTDHLPKFLAEECIIESGTTLRDIFKLCNRHRDFLSQMEARNYFSAYLDYGLNLPIRDLSKVNSNSDDLEIDYLRIKKYIEYENEITYKKDHYLNFTTYDRKNGGKLKCRHKFAEVGDVVPPRLSVYTDFGGISVPVPKKHSEKHTTFRENEVVPIGLFGSDLYDYIDHPVRIEHTVNFSSSKFNSDTEKYEYDQKDLENCYSFTLFEIIHAIFYEISFHGDPERSKKARDEIFKELKESEELEQD